MVEYVEKNSEEIDIKEFDVFEEGVDKKGNIVNYRARTERLNKRDLEQRKESIINDIKEIDRKLALFNEVKNE